MTSDKSYAVEARLNQLMTLIPQIGIVPNGGQLINSTIDAAITNFSFTAAAVVYNISVRLSLLGNQNGGTPVFAFHGPTPAWLGFFGYFMVGNSNTGTQPLTFTYTAAATTMVGPVLVSGTPVTLQIDGSYSCSAAGTLSLQAHEGTTSDTFTILQGSSMWMTPQGF